MKIKRIPINFHIYTKHWTCPTAIEIGAWNAWGTWKRREYQNEIDRVKKPTTKHTFSFLCICVIIPIEKVKVREIQIIFVFCIWIHIQIIPKLRYIDTFYFVFNAIHTYALRSERMNKNGKRKEKKRKRMNESKPATICHWTRFIKWSMPWIKSTLLLNAISFLFCVVLSCN